MTKFIYKWLKLSESVIVNYNIVTFLFLGKNLSFHDMPMET